MTSHLQDEEVTAVVEMALGIGSEGQSTPVGWQLFEHLAACEECRNQVSELSAIVAGEADSTAIPEGPLVDFIPVITPDYLQPEEGFELLAAAHQELAISPFETAGQRTLQSTDEEVQLSIRLVPADHSCRVYPAIIGSIEPAGSLLLDAPGCCLPVAQQEFLQVPGRGL